MMCPDLNLVTARASILSRQSQILEEAQRYRRGEKVAFNPLGSLTGLREQSSRLPSFTTVKPDIPHLRGASSAGVNSGSEVDNVR
jgi:hypothetical protein